ncbi:hypothetical protein DFR76_111253 [Nocardia pseudobrasiliensis]|uniref:Uncharacterized protein n=1 Tax=Nocardia pseudobrasiliensis TaxID=45979 RepID=A0A370I1T6_9NOCA|nr:hypothetical protein DFR76_111253 [Nocardia pseudobrasiliensis]
MSKIIKIPVTPLDEWTTIQVPATAEFVGAEQAYLPGAPGGGPAKYKYTFWFVPDRTGPAPETSPARFAPGASRRRFLVAVVIRTPRPPGCPTPRRSSPRSISSGI